MPDWKERYRSVNGAKLYVEQHGTGEPLICLHNFSSNSRARFMPLLPVLAERYTCYLVDLRGHGRSDNPTREWSHELAALDIIELCKALGIDRARFLAVSSGAMTMLRVARYAPNLVSAMVLDSTTFCVPEAAKIYYKDPATLSPKLKQYYAEANEWYGASYGEELARVFYDFRLPECDINVPLELHHAIECPTLLIHGDRDMFFPSDIPIALRQTIPDSELLIVPSTGHIVMEFHPEMVAQETIAFFDRRTPAL